MAKALKTVAIVVAAVALVATGVGIALGGLAAGAAAGTAGAAAALGSTLITVGTIASVAAGILSMAATLMTPKPSFSGSGNPQQFQTNPQSGLPYNIGRTAFSGIRIRGATTSWRGAYKQDLVAFAALLSVGGAIQGIETFTADGQLYTFDANGYATPYYNHMWQKVSTGQPGAAALSLYAHLGVPFPGWTSAHKLSGISHALWMLRYDFDGNLYTAGVPSPRWVGKWVKVYDPRLDSTYPGGSGPCRALDETTYVWSRNPALHGLTWCLGRWQNGKLTVGIGAPVKMIRVSDFVQAANVADANGWSIGGTVYSLDAKWGVLKSMLQACGAEPTKTAAMFGCRVNMPRVSIATITSADVQDSLTTATTKSRRERINTIRPRFRSEAHDWEVITGSPVTHAAYVTTDGGVRSKELDLPLVQAETDQPGFDGLKQAAQLSAYELVNAREAGPISFSTGPKFIGLRNGDCVTLHVPEEGHNNQKILLTSDPTFDPASGKFLFTAETETDAKHDFALGKTTTPPPPYSPSVPDIVPSQPEADMWALSAGIGGDGAPYLVVQGSSSDASWESVNVAYRRVGDANWIHWGAIASRDAQRAVISGVDGGVSYEARIAYVGPLATGLWRTLDPVTTPGNTVKDKVDGIEPGADVTGNHTSADTAKVYGRPVAQVVSELDLNGQNWFDMATLEAGRDALMLARTTLEGQPIGTVITSFKGEFSDEKTATAESFELLGAKTPDGSAWLLDQSTVTIGPVGGVGPVQSLGQRFQSINNSLGSYSGSVNTLNEVLIDPQTGVTAKAVLALDVNGRVTGIVSTATKEKSTLEMVFDSYNLLAPDGTSLFFAEAGVVKMPAVEVDTLKVNTAVIPIIVSQTTSFGGTGGYINLMSATLNLPKAGVVKVSGAAMQGFSDIPRAWRFQVLINSVVVWEPNGSYPGDTVALQGNRFCDAGTVTVGLRWVGAPGVDLHAREILIEAMPNTE